MLINGWALKLWNNWYASLPAYFISLIVLQVYDCHSSYLDHISWSLGRLVLPNQTDFDLPIQVSFMGDLVCTTTASSRYFWIFDFDTRRLTSLRLELACSCYDPK